MLAAIYAKLPDRAPTVGELRGADASAVLERVPLVRVESGEVTVDRVTDPVEVEGPVDVRIPDEPVAVTIER